MKFYIPPQLPRLALAFAIFISLFLVLRHFLVPDTFGKYGPYRAAALDDYAKLEIHYSGQQACFECHQDIEDLKAQDVHSEIHCETCHGPGQKHVVTSDTIDILIPPGREFCGKCHKLNAAKSKDAIIQIDLREHYIDKNCIECHNAHRPWELKK
jgi:excinuclease UvrABC ATPase subunit